MRNVILVNLCLIACIIKVSGQDWSGKTFQFGKSYPGYVITLKGDTLKGYVVHDTRDGNQNSVIFYTDPNDKKTKTKYKPDELLGYMVSDKNYNSVHYSGGLVAKPLRFVLVTKPGHICKYMWYSKEAGYLGVKVLKHGETEYDYDKRTSTEKIVYQKGDEKFFGMDYFALNFSKKMAELVSDYPELATKVKNKDKGYTLLKLEEIIDEYNTWYAQNNKK